MKSIATLALIVTMAIFAVTEFVSTVHAQPGYMLSGLWKTPEGGEVQIARTGTHLQATFISGGDCPFGETRTTYFEAEVTGTSCSGIGTGRQCDDLLKGSMERCTLSEELFKKCQLPAVYTIYFEATGSRNVIAVKWKNEHYSQNKDDKDRSAGKDPANADTKGCDWTRDPSGDKEIKFNLTRVTSPYLDGKKCTAGKRCH